MAVLASKVSYSSSLGMGPNQPSIVSQYAASYRKPVGAGNTSGENTHPGAFMSPTESEFSQGDDGHESIRSWDEKKVGEWLRSINCAQYDQLFKGTTTPLKSLIESYTSNPCRPYVSCRTLTHQQSTTSLVAISLNVTRPCSKKLASRRLATESASSSLSRL